ncbi:MAG: hypothetical protein ACD_61C00042G0003 [uncultured bacterium]|nr:MAG: hypothetical protein ACD_61C00042G0003 [uncultured bacterium]
MINRLFNFLKNHRGYLYLSLIVIFFLFLFFVQAIQTSKNRTVIPSVPSIISITPTIKPTVNLNDFSDQAKNEIIFNAAWDKLQRDYPWYKYLPIVQKDYVIVYDFDKKSFRIRITNKNASESLKTNIINEAINSLVKIGVDMTKFTYYIIN